MAVPALENMCPYPSQSSRHCHRSRSLRHAEECPRSSVRHEIAIGVADTGDSSRQLPVLRGAELVKTRGKQWEGVAFPIFEARGL